MDPRADQEGRTRLNPNEYHGALKESNLTMEIALCHLSIPTLTSRWDTCLEI
uniref:Uncharacterized protein n=1 Tax=Setaria viridis TaxID=4556 RepID=A0A4U6TEU3_SETVI|nr:hypothetical protein SEVIR_8G050350v2 [Setaria viridis]